MRIGARGDVPRVDLGTLRRLVPPLWVEWAELTFDRDGWLRDPDTGQPLRILQLAQGRHRVSGARYTIVKDEEPLSFVLTSDSNRAIQGTLSGPWWSADLEIGDQLSAVGRADVGAAMRASEVPGCMVSLIGGREATGTMHVDLSRLDRGGELLHAEAAAQRGAGDLAVDVETGRNEWHARVTVQVKGRGMLGRLALLAFRSKARSAIRDALEETFQDTSKDALALGSELADLEDQIRSAGGAQAFVHANLWQDLRELARPADPPESGTADTSQPATADEPARPRRGLLGIGRR